MPNHAYTETPPPDRMIIGVDPGSAITGYGILHHTEAGLRVVCHGVIRLGKLEVAHPLKLARVFDAILSILDTHKPDEMAIEAPFAGKNVQSLLKLGRVQGVVMAAAMSRQIPVAEYAPLRVKKAISGRGHATKEQVAAMLPHLLPGLAEGKAFELPDASDALAIALCHHLSGHQTINQSTSKPKASKKANGWAAFVAENPGRLK